VSQIDQWQEVIGRRQREVWPKAAKAAVDCGGVLVGGTAVAVHLRHRISEDIDILAPNPVETSGVKALLESEANESFSMIGLNPHEDLSGLCGAESASCPQVTVGVSFLDDVHTRNAAYPQWPASNGVPTDHSADISDAAPDLSQRILEFLFNRAVDGLVGEQLVEPEAELAPMG